jgi:hypothetical protein
MSLDEELVRPDRVAGQRLRQPEQQDDEQHDSKKR